MSLLINEKYPLSTSLDWEIEERPVFNATGDEIAGYKQILNGSNKKLITVAKKSYTPVRNERLVELCEKMAENTPFLLQGFACYNAGAKVMAYLKNEHPIAFGGQKTEDYLVIGNSHDGTSAFFTGLTNRIYRCENMFSKNHQQNRIRHTLNHEQEIRMIEQTHDLYFNHRTGVYEMADRMLEVAVNMDKRIEFVSSVLKLNDKQEQSSYIKNVKEKLLTSIIGETHELGQNLFGLFNGVTHYTSNVMNQRKAVFGNPFNLANTLNQRAYQFCQQELEKFPKKTMVLKM